MSDVKYKKHRGKKHNKKPQDGFVPSGNPSSLQTKLEDAGFSETTLAALKKGKLETMKDIACRREFEMYHIQNINKKVLKEIAGVMRKFGLEFRPGDIDHPAPDGAPLPRGEYGRAHEKNSTLGRSGGEADGVVQLEFLRRPAKRKIITLAERLAKEEKPVYEKGSFIRFMRKGLWGFKDENGKVLIEPEYEEVFDFKEGLASAEKDGLCGYINKSGETVIPFEFEAAMSFSEGFAVVTKGEKSGYIDKDGKLAIDYQFDIASPMTDGRAIVRLDDRWAFVDGSGKVEVR